MKPCRIGVTAVLLMTELVCGGCLSGVTTRTDKVVASTKTGDMTVSLANTTGELKKGENDLILTFADPPGKTVDVGAASLKLHMPPMIGMAEMTDTAVLTTTDLPGRYRAQVTIEVAGTWEAIVKYQGNHGTGQARMTVSVK